MASAGAGYHWFWQSFNMSFGLMITDQSQISLKNSTGLDYKDPIDQRFGIDFTIGGKF